MAASPSSGPVGRPEPRLGTAPLRRLTRKTSAGFEAAEFCEQVLGMTLMPWQRTWLIRALELDPAGGFRFRTVVTLVGRQSGKTTLMVALSLWMMFTSRARLVLGSAQSLDIAREAWQGAVDLAQGEPSLRAEVAQVRRANGEQCLTLTNGSRYRITAATQSAGRGLSVDLLMLDELREHRSWAPWGALSKTTTARANALTVCFSNAGDDGSVVLNHLRASALAGGDPALGLFEWSAPEGCDLDDVEGWCQSNPALGHTVSEAVLRSSLATDPPGVFRTEVLCQRVIALDSAVDAAAWEACTDPATGGLDRLRRRVVLGLDVAPDLKHATLVAAAVGDDGRTRVEVVAAWTSTKACRDALGPLLDRVRPRALAWFPSGPTAALKADLQGFREQVEVRDVQAACAGLVEAVASRRLLHPGDGLLTAHVAGADRVPSGEGFKFSRRGEHVDGAYALAAAVHVARSLPAGVGRPRILVAG